MIKSVSKQIREISTGDTDWLEDRAKLHVTSPSNDKIAKKIWNKKDERSL